MEDNGNKGFTLLELIIVIAIMAVLVGFIVPMYIRYVEKSKLANDKQLVYAIHNALAAAIMDENIADRPLGGVPKVKLEELDDPGGSYYYHDFIEEFKGFVQVDDIETLKNGLKSKDYKGQDINVEINGTTQQVKVTVDNKLPGGDKIEIE